jgi:hypothetical protein
MSWSTQRETNEAAYSGDAVIAARFGDDRRSVVDFRIITFHSDRQGTHTDFVFV